MANFLKRATEHYRLDIKTIDNVIRKKSPGNYRLGNMYNNEFQVEYVGRSDTDVGERLKAHVRAGEPYERFMFSYVDSEKEAFEKECWDYHMYGEESLDNIYHPDRPEGKGYTCPICDIFD